MENLPVSARERRRDYPGTAGRVHFLRPPRTLACPGPRSNPVPNRRLVTGSDRSPVRARRVARVGRGRRRRPREFRRRGRERRPAGREQRRLGRGHRDSSARQRERRRPVERDSGGPAERVRGCCPRRDASPDVWRPLSPGDGQRHEHRNGDDPERHRGDADLRRRRPDLDPGPPLREPLGERVGRADRQDRAVAGRAVPRRPQRRPGPHRDDRPLDGRDGDVHRAAARARLKRSALPRRDRIHRSPGVRRAVRCQAPRRSPRPP